MINHLSGPLPLLISKYTQIKSHSGGADGEELHVLRMWNQELSMDLEREKESAPQLAHECSQLHHLVEGLVSGL